MTTDIMMVRWMVVFLVYAALVLDNILLTVVGKDEWHTRSLLIHLETIKGLLSDKSNISTIINFRLCNQSLG